MYLETVSKVHTDVHTSQKDEENEKIT